MSITREGRQPSQQISVMGPIDISAGNFERPGDRDGFNIKNDSGSEVELTVLLLDMKDTDTPITTKFQEGWNPEIVRKVYQNPSVTGLFWGD